MNIYEAIIKAAVRMFIAYLLAEVFIRQLSYMVKHYTGEAWVLIGLVYILGVAIWTAVLICKTQKEEK